MRVISPRSPSTQTWEVRSPTSRPSPLHSHCSRAVVGVVVRQALTQDHKLIHISLRELEHRCNQDNSCICVYTSHDQLCTCAAKLKVTEEDYRAARAEMQRRGAAVAAKQQKKPFAEETEDFPIGALLDEEEKHEDYALSKQMQKRSCDRASSDEDEVAREHGTKTQRGPGAR